MVDSNAFYSGIAQAGASIAGLGTAFILARLITISGTRKGLQNTLKEFDNREGRIVEKSLQWLLKSQYADGSWNGDVEATTHAVSALQVLQAFGEKDRVDTAIEYGLNWLQYKKGVDDHGVIPNTPDDSDEIIRTSNVISTLADFASERKQISSNIASQYLPKSAIWGLIALGFLLVVGVLLPLLLMLIPEASCGVFLWISFLLFLFGILGICIFIAKETYELTKILQ